MLGPVALAFVLDTINADRLPRFANGGAAGRAALRQSAASKRPPINIRKEVTVNASGGTPAQHGDLAKQVDAQLEDACARPSSPC